MAHGESSYVHISMHAVEIRMFYAPVWVIFVPFTILLQTVAVGMNSLISYISCEKCRQIGREHEMLACNVG